MKIKVEPRGKLAGKITVPGDKSISHRAQLFGALAVGTTKVTGLSGGEDVRSTGKCLRAMGVKIEQNADETVIHGVGLRGLQAPQGNLDCGNSGSTIRMLMGILAGQNFSSTCVGDASLSKRPMKRVAEPLFEMGARIDMKDGTYAPLTVHGQGKLRTVDYHLKVASAQVKSAVLLAGLYADGETIVRGRTDSRDHTERLLPYFGAKLSVESGVIKIRGGQELRGTNFRVPGDPSSAAFWVAAAAVVPGSSVEIEHCLLNPSRTGFLQVVKRMGLVVDDKVTTQSPEPTGNVTARFAKLKGTTIAEPEVPSLIDELPLIAVLATYATGVTEVRGAEELRVKETDRIEAVADNLRRMGAVIETFEDGFRIEGPQRLRGAKLDSYHDHRIAMAFAIATLGADGPSEIDNADSVAISYPSFWETLEKLTHG